MDQDDVLRKKGGVTSSDRGLQIWGDEELGDDGVGTGGSGTAERAAKIAHGQKKRPDEE
ncbi:MAG TPA: hypothetical protein VM370_01655 [Candidatus Thermoplasmatota archaeon]|nr:hypothetical protein [Candidatus Thermoplasmatota archaeon]